MYRVTYCKDVANHGYGCKYFETKEEALEWCKNHIGGLHTREYEELIDFVAR